MDENDHGREIVLGNKQLLSMFFIVAAMLGVAFTMGYIIGRNTTAVSAASASTSAPPVVKKAAPAEGQDAESGTTSETTSETTSAARTESNPPAPVTGTQPAKPYAEDTPAALPAHPAEHAAPAPGAGPSGSYLQVAALKRQDADRLVASLSKRGYPALLGESPKEGLFRVLIGPFKDAPSLADSKQRLKAAGIDTIIAR